MPPKKIYNFLSKYLIIISLCTIILIGLCVILGWHIQSGILVRIIPNAISMQYNTALCFIILALSAATLVLPKLPKISGITGGILVTLLGITVIFQYTTGIQLGIDTFFFYPWDQTLSSSPGRMALTTAICFVIAGASLCLLIINTRTLIVFVLAHTFPVSFGITSLLGYFFGITYVLPFHLGSQMAVHTAFAFTIYGVAMLFYAWQYIPQTQEDLPKWIPGIAVIMVPVFFVSLSSALPNTSLWALFGQIILALIGATLLGIILYKLMQARILYKGLILISIPLLFVLGFVVLVNQQKSENEKAQIMALHSKEVIANTHSMTEKLLEAESNLRGYIVTENEYFRELYDTTAQQIPEQIKKLETLVSDNPQQSAKAYELGNKAYERIAILEQVKNMVIDGRRAELTELMKKGVGRSLMSEFQIQKNSFLEEEKNLEEMRHQAVKSSWQKFDWLLVSGASADLLLALTLTFLFTRGIGRRLQILTENSQALADGKSLAQPLTGTDEIAKLDQVFHQMARALTKSQNELESKVEERTKELSEATTEIKKINESLEQRVTARTAELEAANKELESFSYSVSHDLRAPLRAIDGFSRIILEDYEPDLDEEARNLLAKIRKNTKHMGHLIDDLLSLSRLGQKQMEPVLIDMTKLVKDVCLQIESNSVPIKNLTIKQLPETTGDKALIRQVLFNLISNAIKYSGKKEDSLIEIGGQKENGQNIYFIRDNGVGFDMQYAHKLFGVFQRLHSIQEFEGTGVGLALVQRIIQRHGGQVWAESEVDKGSTFYFALPHN